ncbi:insulinase family protein [Thalassotalea montiporae]
MCRFDFRKKSLNAYVLMFISAFTTFFSTAIFANHVLPSPEAFDNNLSNYVELDNGLRVLLLSDPQAKSSAASITINVGGRHSPKSFQGLAHLLEHTVFLGSKSYSGTKDFDGFVKKHNGWSNGTTRPLTTRYHFQLNNSPSSDALIEGLTRLHDMLINPLMREDDIKLAIEEVDEEFQSRKSNDFAGIVSVFKANMSPNNSARYMDVGNKISLQGTTTDIKHVSSALKAFHQNYYKLENMTLAVYSKQDLNTLEGIVKQVFKSPKTLGQTINQNPITKISNRQFSTHRMPYSRLYEKDDLGKRIDVLSSTDRPALDLRFEVPANEKQAIAYIRYLLDYNNSGSLAHYLNQKGLAHNAFAAVHGDKLNTVINIYVDLTNDGYHQINTVIEAIFAYFNHLKTNQHPDYLQRELITTQASDYKRPIEMEPGDWLSELSNQMHVANSSDIFASMYIAKPVTQSTIDKLLSHFSVNNFQAYVSSSQQLTSKTQQTPHYLKPYTEQRISPTLLTQWQFAKNDSFSLPKQNPYLKPRKRQTPEVSSSITAQDKLAAQIVTNPAFAIEDSLLIRLSNFTLNNEFDNDTKNESMAYPNSYVLFLLMAEQLTRNLGDNHIYAELAGYHFNEKVTNQSLGLVLSGKQSHIVDYAFDLISPFHRQKLSAAEFDALKKSAYRNYENILQENEFRQVIKAATNQGNSLPSINATLEQINAVTLADYQTFVAQILPSLTIYTDSIANSHKFSTRFVTHLDSEPVAANTSNVSTSKVNVINTNASEMGSLAKQFKILNVTSEKQAALAFTIVFNPNLPFLHSQDSVKANALLHMFKQMTTREYRDEIRVKQQLAYHAGSLLLNTQKPAFSFVAESSKVNATELAKITKVFFIDTVSQLTNENNLTTNQQKFLEAKPIVIEQLNTFYRREQQLHQLNWQLDNSFINLDYNALISDEINRMTYQEFNDWLITLVDSIS